MFFMAINRIRKESAGPETAAAISSHVAWTKRMIAGGMMVQAGRWGERGGMAILRAESIEQARGLVEQDPLVTSGVVDLELARLYPDVEIK